MIDVKELCINYKICIKIKQIQKKDKWSGYPLDKLKSGLDIHWIKKWTGQWTGYPLDIHWISTG